MGWKRVVFVQWKAESRKLLRIVVELLGEGGRGMVEDETMAIVERRVSE